MLIVSVLFLSSLKLHSPQVVNPEQIVWFKKQGAPNSWEKKIRLVVAGSGGEEGGTGRR